MIKLFTILFSLCAPIISTTTSYAQTVKKLNCIHFNINDGLLQSAVHDMAFDKNGFGWLSFSTGLLRFDGKRFLRISVQDGLPSDANINFLKDKNQRLWLAHPKGLSMYNEQTNRFQLMLALNVKDQLASPISTLLPFTDDDYIYFFTTADSLVVINIHTGIVTNKIRIPFLPKIITEREQAYSVSNNVVNHQMFFKTNNLFYAFDVSKMKLLKIWQPKQIADFTEFAITNDHQIIYQNNKGIQQQDFLSEKIESLVLLPSQSKNPLRTNLFLMNQQMALASVDNLLYLIDLASHTIKNRYANLDGKAFTDKPIAKIRSDIYGNIYLLTVAEGFKKIIHNPYPFKIYKTNEPKHNFITCLSVDKKANRIYAGTFGNGLLVFDTLQNLIQRFTHLPNEKESFTPTCICRLKDGRLAFVALNKIGLFILNKTNTSIQVVPFSLQKNKKLNRIGYYGSLLVQTDSVIYMLTDNTLIHIQQYPQLQIETSNINIGNVAFAGISSNQHIYLATSRGLQILSAADLTTIATKNYPNLGNGRALLQLANGEMYESFEKGLLKLDSNGNILEKKTNRDGLPDDCIYAMATDENGNLWCSSNRGVFMMDKANGFKHFKKEDGLQENEFNTNVVYKASDGEMYFGGINGLNSFYPSSLNQTNDSAKAFITTLSINEKPHNTDVAIWEQSQIELPYNENRLVFEFVALGRNSPEQYIYQYKMDGVDADWIMSAYNTQARYNLQPGKYFFQLVAAKSFNKKAKPTKTLTIIILPPFWKRWWFVSFCIIIGIAIIFLVANNLSKKKFKDKLKLIEQEQMLQAERKRIAADLHDNLGAYAAAISANVLAIQQSGQVQTNSTAYLEQNANFMVNELGNTIWVLKKEKQSLTEISDRFKMWMQKLMLNYPAIAYDFAEDIDNDQSLSPSHALHLFYMLQEGINNAVRHANCKHILIHWQSDANWQIQIADDGDGFDGHSVNVGNGLLNMQQRATQCGWAVEWKKNQPKGTIIIIKNSL